MSYATRVIKGAGIIFAFSIFSMLFGYLMRLVLARNLTVAEFGFFYSAFSLFTFFTMFKDVGMTKALVKHIPEFRIKGKYNSIKNAVISVLCLQFIISTIITILFIIFSGMISEHLFHDKSYSFIIILFALAFWPKPLNLVLAGLFQGFQKMTYYASIDFFRAFTVLLLSFVGFLFFNGLIVPTVVNVIVPILILIIFVPILIKKVFPEFSKESFYIDKPLINNLFKFGILNLLGTSLIWSIVGYIDVFMLTYYNGLEQVGLYNAALPTASLMSFFCLAIATTILPITSELWAKGNKKELIYGIKKVHIYSFALVTLISLVVFCFPDFILKILFGDDYVAGSNALRILSLGIIIAAIGRINMDTLLGIGKVKIVAIIALSTLVFNLIINFIFIGIMKLGIIGASISALLTFLMIFILSQLSLRHFADIQIPIIQWINTLIAGCIFVGIIYFLRKIFVLNPYLELILILFIASSVYILLLFIFKVISFNEIKNLVMNTLGKRKA